MIRFPKSDLIVERAKALRVPVAVIVRDLARIVEIINLRDQGFFDDRSVLAGGMAMRTYGSQRLTIYDADLSTRAIVAPGKLREMLTYTSEEIEIRPTALVPTSDGGKVWKSDPVEFDPIWITLAIEPADRRFKVDMAGYGVIADGVERPLTDPYELGLFEGDKPSVIVMCIEEIAAEKTLGWCAHRLYKHLADLAFIAENFGENIDRKRLREILDRKLAIMRELQPTLYERLHSIEDLIAEVNEPGVIAQTQERGIQFLRNPYTPQQVKRLVRDRYVPLLRA